MIRLNSKLEDTLRKLKEAAKMASEQGYFDYFVSHTNFVEKEYIKELEQLGFLRKSAGWDLHFNNGESGFKATFLLLSKALTYDEDKEMNEKAIGNSTTNIYGNMSNSQIQQNTQNSNQNISIQSEFDFEKALKLFNGALEVSKNFGLSEDETKKLVEYLESGKKLSESKSDTNTIKNILNFSKEILMRASTNLIASIFAEQMSLLAATILI
ncbi:MAG: hypothetical protein FWF50_01820 [Defluviitaleaceae bacterium]|nr:hypothetical protein [Defluviitaleaceae bacterium]